jgi:hypothetical protein
LFGPARLGRWITGVGGLGTTSWFGRSVKFGAGNEVAVVTLDENDTGPSGGIGTMKPAAFSSNFGSHVAVVLEAAQPASAQTITATISGDLVLKE